MKNHVQRPYCPCVHAYCERARRTVFGLTLYRPAVRRFMLLIPVCGQKGCGDYDDISSKKINLIAILLTALALAFTVYAMTLPGEAVSGSVTGTVEYGEQHAVTYSDDDYYSNYAEGAIAKINLLGSAASSESKNVSITGSEITILGGGTYVLSGELTNGSIIVDSGDSAVVHLVLNGVSVTSEDFAAIYVKQAEKTVISTVYGTESHLADGSAYSAEKLEDGKPSAAVYSKDDLTINGGGTLVVTGNYEDGIKANDTLKITEGTLKVTAVDDGINAQRLHRGFRSGNRGGIRRRRPKVRTRKRRKGLYCHGGHKPDCGKRRRRDLCFLRHIPA